MSTSIYVTQKTNMQPLNASAYFLNIYIYIYISPKLEIHRRDDNHKTYFLHKYHRCPKEVNIIKEGFPTNIVQNNII